jgi:hypothetical protein
MSLVYTASCIHNRPAGVNTVRVALLAISRLILLDCFAVFFAILLHRFASFRHLFMPLTACFFVPVKLGLLLSDLKDS